METVTFARMIPTPDFITTCFERFNRELFGGQLPTPTFRLTRAQTYLGNMRCMRRKPLFGRARNTNFVMSFSTAYDLEEAEWEDTVIHEMIHLSIMASNLHDDAPHGTLFQRMMTTINQRYGRHITVSHHSDPATSRARREARLAAVKVHYVCVVEYDARRLGTGENGQRLGCAVCARTRLFQIHRALVRWLRPESIRWFATTDPFFNRYPRVTTAKIYGITQEDIDAHLSDAVEYLYTGRAFVVRRRDDLSSSVH